MLGVIGVLAIWLIVTWRMEMTINKRYNAALEHEHEEAHRHHDALDMDEKKGVPAERVVQSHELEAQRG